MPGKATTVTGPHDLVGENRRAAQALADFVNHNVVRPQEFAEYVVHHTHRTLQQQMMRLFWACIVEWAKAARKRQFDDRNTATVMLSEEIVRKVGEDHHFTLI